VLANTADSSGVSGSRRRAASRSACKSFVRQEPANANPGRRLVSLNIQSDGTVIFASQAHCSHSTYISQPKYTDFHKSPPCYIRVYTGVPDVSFKYCFSNAVMACGQEYTSSIRRLASETVCARSSSFRNNPTTQRANSPGVWAMKMSFP
jgi:hypothetical protein